MPRARLRRAGMDGQRAGRCRARLSPTTHGPLPLRGRPAQCRQSGPRQSGRRLPCRCRGTGAPPGAHGALRPAPWQGKRPGPCLLPPDGPQDGAAAGLVAGCRRPAQGPPRRRRPQRGTAAAPQPFAARRGGGSNPQENKPLPRKQQGPARKDNVLRAGPCFWRSLRRGYMPGCRRMGSSYCSCNLRSSLRRRFVTFSISGFP